MLKEMIFSGEWKKKKGSVVLFCLFLDSQIIYLICSLILGETNVFVYNLFSKEFLDLRGRCFVFGFFMQKIQERELLFLLLFSHLFRTYML